MLANLCISGDNFPSWGLRNAIADAELGIVRDPVLSAECDRCISPVF
jgi:hypothetical protein